MTQKHHFFLDETGDHGLSFIDANFPVFLLCGCLIEESHLAKLEDDINSLKIDLFGSEDVILHSREIRKCEGAFQVLFDLDVKKDFYARINGILAGTEFTIIGAAVNKEKHIKTYGKSASDPYGLCLSFILERLVFCLDHGGATKEVGIKVEERGKKEDKQLLSHYNSIIDSGTYFVSAERLKKKIVDFCFQNKSENVNGLQLADLCAYPLARHILSPKAPYIPFNIIKSKLYCDTAGKADGWGLKIFP